MMVKKFLKNIVPVVLMSVSTMAMASKGEPWITDMDQAQKIAKAEGKDILMFFTGSDWCAWCLKLDEEVLSKEEFLSYANENLVLVDLDFPSDEDIISEEQREHNEKWRSVLKPSGFPSVYLANASAIAYAKTGYEAGGPVAYVETLKKFKANQQVVLDLRAEADQAKGLERAKLLDQLLGYKSPTITGRNELISEVITLSEGRDEALYQKYLSLKSGRDMLREGSEALKAAGGNTPEAVSKLISVYDKYDYITDEKVLSQFLQGQLARAFASSGKAAEGAEFFGAKAADKSKPLNIRQMLMVFQAFMVAETGEELKAVELVETAAAMDSNSRVAKDKDRFYSQISETVRRAKLRKAP